MQTAVVSLYQTSATNSNDADLFIAYDGSLGIDSQYTPSGVLNSNTWYRIGVVVDLTQPANAKMKTYINGTEYTGSLNNIPPSMAAGR